MNAGPDGRARAGGPGRHASHKLCRSGASKNPAPSGLGRVPFFACLQRAQFRSSRPPPRPFRPPRPRLRPRARRRGCRSPLSPLRCSFVVLVPASSLSLRRPRPRLRRPRARPRARRRRPRRCRVSSSSSPSSYSSSSSSSSSSPSSYSSLRRPRPRPRLRPRVLVVVRGAAACFGFLARETTWRSVDEGWSYQLTLTLDSNRTPPVRDWGRRVLQKCAQQGKVARFCSGHGLKAPTLYHSNARTCSRMALYYTQPVGLGPRAP